MRSPYAIPPLADLAIVQALTDKVAELTAENEALHRERDEARAEVLRLRAGIAPRRSQWKWSLP